MDPSPDMPTYHQHRAGADHDGHAFTSQPQYQRYQLLQVSSQSAPSLPSRGDLASPYQWHQHQQYAHTYARPPPSVLASSRSSSYQSTSFPAPSSPMPTTSTIASGLAVPAPSPYSTSHGAAPHSGVSAMTTSEDVPSHANASDPPACVSSAPPLSSSPSRRLSDPLEGTRSSAFVGDETYTPPLRQGEASLGGRTAVSTAATLSRSKSTGIKTLSDLGSTAEASAPSHGDAMGAAAVARYSTSYTTAPIGSSYSDVGAGKPRTIATLPKGREGALPIPGVGMLSKPNQSRVRISLSPWTEANCSCFVLDYQDPAFPNDEKKRLKISRRATDNYINGTKLLNFKHLTRGKRDSLLKNERDRLVIRSGSSEFKGVWIPFDQALQLAVTYDFVHNLYPLFEKDLHSFVHNPLHSVDRGVSSITSHGGFGYGPSNLASTSQPYANAKPSPTALAAGSSSSTLPDSRYGAPGMSSTWYTGPPPSQVIHSYSSTSRPNSGGRSGPHSPAQSKAISPPHAPYHAHAYQHPYEHDRQHESTNPMGPPQPVSYAHSYYHAQAKAFDSPVSSHSANVSASDSYSADVGYDRLGSMSLSSAGTTVSGGGSGSASADISPELSLKRRRANSDQDGGSTRQNDFASDYRHIKRTRDALDEDSPAHANVKTGPGSGRDGFGLEY